MTLPALSDARAQAVTDNAAWFGAFESIRDASLSPDGTRIACIENGQGLMRRLFVVDTTKRAAPKQILSSDVDNGFFELVRLGHQCATGPPDVSPGQAGRRDCRCEQHDRARRGGR
ncbi:hypothetical protein CDQ92_11620 [Sphingopyxis bauzanensis]|uniref:Uncharacterized protein n=1 Tax=Sphingopyxis bauzanensis TaxID=651663 RepID=A0A246JRB7_9SPHN|nr:hypothetical protein CDQ92_11620 [Sphingopyxis bauzanensis]